MCNVSMKNVILKIWYQQSIARYFLIPLSWLYGIVVAIRKKYMLSHVKPLSKPVIVVGNITVGGTGKTPLVITLVQHIQSMGLKPGVISRGYKGAANYPYTVNDYSTAAACGDEPLLIYQRCRCPVVVDPDRLAAANQLITDFKIDIIISDDGMQHYRLPRQMELAVIDSQRVVGNGHLLPAGPLRESIKRLDTTDFIITNGQLKSFNASSHYTMHLIPADLEPIGRTLGQPKEGQTMHAIAAIGNPDRFFTTLTTMGFDLMQHPFPDHYHFQKEDLLFNDLLPVIMTEKDAVKCQHFEDLDKHWYLPVSALLPPSFWQQFEEKLHRLL